MDEEKVTNESTIEETVVTPAVLSDVVEETAEVSLGKRKFTGRRDGDRKKNTRRMPRKDDRIKPEFDQKIIGIRRVTRVVAGGRRMSFSVAVVAGNRKGKVGVGVGKAVDTALAIDKAFRDAKRNMVVVKSTKTNSIPHDVESKYSASRVLLIPAKGRGIVAGGSVRTVVELAGLTDISGKLLSRSKNGINNARAAVKALSSLRPRKTVVK